MSRAGIFRAYRYREAVGLLCQQVCIGHDQISERPLQSADSAYHSIDLIAGFEASDFATNFFNDPSHIKSEHRGKRLFGMRCFARSSLGIKRIDAARTVGRFRLRQTRRLSCSPYAAGMSTRRTGDGRHPVDNTTEQFDVAVHQVRVNVASGEPSTTQFQRPAPLPLETDEVTVLTGWARAVAEVLAQAPERMKELLADAKAEAPWRATLRLEEPSQPLGDALFCLNQVVRAVTPPLGTPTTDALLSACSEDQPDEPRLERLVRRVLRSTIEQLLVRHAAEARE